MLDRIRSRFNIRFRILLTFVFVCSLGLYHLGSWLSKNARRHYLESAEEMMHDEVLLLRRHFYNQQGKVQLVAGTEMLRQLYNKPLPVSPKAQIYDLQKTDSDTAIYITDKLGQILFHSDQTQKHNIDFSQWRNVRLALKGKYGARSTRARADDPSSSVLHITLPINSADGKSVLGTISLRKPVARLSIYLQHSRDRILHMSILTLAFVLLIGYLLMQRITAPIAQLTQHVAKLSEGQRPQLPKLPPGEMRLLGQSIDEMRRNLDGKDYIEDYVQTLTHELKSPLAAISGAVELLDESDNPQQQKLLGNINRESERMTAMVHKLLTLARLENQSPGSDFLAIDLARLLQGLIHDLQQRLPERPLQLTLAESTSTNIQGEEILLRSAIENLILNADDFSPANSAINIELKMQETGFFIIIDDQGCGIPDYALPRIFERFYSLPRPASGRKSSGLGLSIVQRITSLHQGTINIESHANGNGVRCQVFLPK